MRIRLFLVIVALVLAACLTSKPTPVVKADPGITFFQAHAACEAQSDAWIQSCLMGSNTGNCWNAGYNIYTGCMAAHGWPINN